MNAINKYHLPADHRELLVRAVEEAADRRALRAADVERIQNQLRWTRHEEAKRVYAAALDKARVALAIATRIEQDAKARLEQHLADGDAERMSWHQGDVEFLPNA